MDLFQETGPPRGGSPLGGSPLGGSPLGGPPHESRILRRDLDLALLQDLRAGIFVWGRPLDLPSAAARGRLVRWAQERWRLRSVAENRSRPSEFVGVAHRAG